MVRTAAIALAAGLAGCATETQPCGPDEVCSVDGGRYLAWAPAGWDGRQTLPVIVRFHGHGGTPDGGSVNPLRDAASDAGVLLLLPEGDAQTWNVTGVEGFSATQRDELAFMDAVLADAEARFPLDPERRLATGFSQGTSVASLLGCTRPDDWPMVYAMSGTFWDPHPASCAAPVPIRHIHGDTDGTWPRAGRPIGPAMQGDVDESLALWRETNGCGAATETFEDGPLTCTRWTDCSGAPVEDCRHGEGHTRLDGWADRTLAWWQAQ
jgi:polyhydroxybutyrate depolymerase